MKNLLNQLHKKTPISSLFEEFANWCFLFLQAIYYNKTTPFALHNFPDT